MSNQRKSRRSRRKRPPSVPAKNRPRKLGKTRYSAADPMPKPRPDERARHQTRQVNSFETKRMAATTSKRDGGRQFSRPTRVLFRFSFLFASSYATLGPRSAVGSPVVLWRTEKNRFVVFLCNVNYEKITTLDWLSQGKQPAKTIAILETNSKS